MKKKSNSIETELSSQQRFPDLGNKYPWYVYSLLRGHTKTMPAGRAFASQAVTTTDGVSRENLLGITEGLSFMGL